jgi:hypothetical protein
VKELLTIDTVGELAQVPIARLITCFGETEGRWLACVARGEDMRMEDGHLKESLVEDRWVVN